VGVEQLRSQGGLGGNDGAAEGPKGVWGAMMEQPSYLEVCGTARGWRWEWGAKVSSIKNKNSEGGRVGRWQLGSQGG
jgi:hypothetical protein